MDREPVGPPPKEETRDAAEAVVRSGVGLTPFVGGPLAELATVMLEKAIPRRREAWLRKLAEAVDYLQAYAIDVQELADNEVFVSVLQQATDAACGGHIFIGGQATRRRLT